MKDHCIGIFNSFPVYERTDIPDNHIHCGMGLLKDALGMANIENVPYKGYNVHFDTAIGTDRCVEVNPTDKIVMWKRPTRKGATPMVVSQKLATPAYDIFIRICQDVDHDDRLTIVTTYIGQQGPKEPWDLFKTEEEYNKSVKFWSSHALIPTPIELEQMKADGVI